MSNSPRQPYEEMRTCIAGFKGHTVKLGDLVERLPELLKQIENVDEVWKAEYVSCWWTLEQVHGDAIEVGESGRLPGGTRETVDDAIQSLERLVNGVLAKAH